MVRKMKMRIGRNKGRNGIKIARKLNTLRSNTLKSKQNAKKSKKVLFRNILLRLAERVGMPNLVSCN